MRATLLIAFAVLPGCATYQDDLARAQTAVEASQYDQAVALFRRLERDMQHLDAADRARYAYLRGITDYRVGYHAEARHWLSFAQATDKLHPGSLKSEWKAQLADALAEMNEKVFEVGAMRLTNDRDPHEATPGAARSDVP